MANESPRVKRVADQLQRELASLIQLEVSDPRVGMVSVTGVEVSRDLAHATVFVTVMGSPDALSTGLPDEPPGLSDDSQPGGSLDELQIKESVKALNKAAGYLRNLLARYEIHVANYYFKRGAYLAATARGRYVLENYPRTPAIPDALAVMVQGYKELKMEEPAEQMLAILRTNYPNHPVLDSNGQFNEQFRYGSDERSWISRLTFGLFDKRDPPGFDTRELYDPEYQKPARPGRS